MQPAIKRVGKQALLRLFLGVLLVYLMAGCTTIQRKPVVKKTEEVVTPAPQPVEKKVEAEEKVVEEKTPYVHAVQWPGESLSIISAWYTGDVLNWRKLAEFNPNINPDTIFVGDQITIPDKLLIRQDAMTREHVKKYLAKAGSKKTMPEKQESVEEEKKPELFGPKGLPSN